jgi:plasmid stabilization system protein ParE
MAYRIEWSPRAVEDLEAIAEYIALDSNAYARAVVRKIIEVTRNFARFPLTGRIVARI